ncbi:unnamed protein product, partial [marine sediment metagenome]
IINSISVGVNPALKYILNATQHYFKLLIT